jgi:hypothetical protein
MEVCGLGHGEGSGQSACGKGEGRGGLERSVRGVGRGHGVMRAFRMSKWRDALTIVSETMRDELTLNNGEMNGQCINGRNEWTMH